MILRRRISLFVVLAACGVLGLALAEEQGDRPGQRPGSRFDRTIQENTDQMLQHGRQIFRFDTFGDEAFWGDTLKLHQAIEGSNFGGVGSGVSPRTALAIGLKVDVDALPEKLQEEIEEGKVNLNDPATTLALLKLNAVVGVSGFFNPNSASLRSMGIQCALCHSTVDNSLAFGIGHRLDGWPNRDLDVGTIVSLAPDLSVVSQLLLGKTDTASQNAIRNVIRQWGPGRFDAEVFMDGKAVNPHTNKTAPTMIPPAFGLAGVNLHTWTGWGSVTHWNAFVANLEMHGVGTFFDPRLDNATQFPIAAANGFGHVNPPAGATDQITSKLAALHFYQLAIPAPRPPEGGFDPAAAARGKDIFNGKARCAACHVPPLFTEPGWNLHAPEDIGIDDFQANRAPDRRYRTSPLKAVATRDRFALLANRGRFFHDGRFATLTDVVRHYDSFFGLGLSDDEINDLVEYVKSL